VVVITEQNHDRFQKLTDDEKRKLKGAKGGGSMTIQQPSAPAAPSVADSAAAWAEAMPKIYETELKYAPLQAQQEVELAQKYAQPYGLAMKEAQEALYPGTSAIQEKLAGQALEGMSSGVPQWMKDQYLSDLRSNLGANVGSGVAADYTSRGLLSLNEDWRRYNQNLGLSVTGRQPLTMAQTPQTGQYSQGFTPDQALSYGASTYGSYAGLYGNMYNSNANAAIASANNRTAMAQSWMGLAGTAMGAGVGMYAAR
jgi:hypothetical protein